MGSYRLALGTRLVEALDSRAKTAALAVVIGLLFGSTEFLVPVNKHFWLHLAAMVGSGTAISYLLLIGARARRLAVLEHLRKIAELNHNVRNALEVILSTHYLNREMSEQDRRLVLTSVERIDQTLRHVFPAVGERREDRAGSSPPDMRRPSRSVKSLKDEDRRASQ